MGFHFDETVGVHEVPDEPDDGRPLDENAVRLRRDDQVHIPLPVAGLLVGEPVPLVGKGTDGFCQKGERCDRQGGLAGLREEKDPIDPDDVAKVKGIGDPGILLPQKVGPHIDLKALPLILESGEEGLPELPEKDDATGDPGGRGWLGKRVRGQIPRSGAKGGDRFAARKGSSIRVDSPE